MLRKLVVACLLLIAVAAALWAWRPGDLKDILADGPFRSTAGFERHRLPIEHTDRLFDIGVVDANGDGWLDIYTSNHHFRQVLLLADGQGGYRDVAGEWGLDQSREFPLAELSFSVPELDKPGVYVYWRGTNVIVRSHRMQETGRWRGSMHIYSGVKIVGREGFQADSHETRDDAVVRTRVDFEPRGDGMLVLTPGSQGLPLDFHFEGGVRPEQIFVGLGKVQPKSATFSLAMRDRHAMAWADFNGDGVMDVFINRGALGGALRAFPREVVDAVRDELLVSRAPGRFVDAAAELGIDKQGCSGRHAMWVDFDGDGLLDLFVNCYDRDAVEGDYPKQLYRQHPKGVLRNVASEVGLGLPDDQMTNLVWLDVDADGRLDLVAFQPDHGVVLYRNDGRTFVREIVVAMRPDVAGRIQRATGSASYYDGKLAVGDYDADGRADIFLASRHGNVLLRNTGGRFEVADLAAAGLPASSMYAAWVDFDNDGLLDLHCFPHGLYRQGPDHRFEKTGALATHPDRYQAAMVTWADLDNDGRLDVLFAFEENPKFTPWWSLGSEPSPRARWHVEAFRNVSPHDHHWLQVDLLGTPDNREGVGALVTARRGQTVLTRGAGWAEGSFFSQGHHRAYFGLGAGSGLDSLEVRWSDGHRQRVDSPGVDRRLVIRRDGDGSASGAPAVPPARP